MLSRSITEFSDVGKRLQVLWDIGMICKSGAGQDGWVGVRLDLRNEEVFPGGQREPRAARVEGRGQEGRGVGFLDWGTHPSVRVSETLLAG